MAKINLKKLLKVGAAKKIFNKFPKELKFFALRNLLNINFKPPTGVTFKIAETPQEFSQAFRLLHDAYVDVGLMKPSPYKVRVTPYHLLPTTTTLVAKFNDTVVGTVSLIRRGEFGVPSESAFDLKAVIAGGRQIAEISAIAITPSWRGKLFLPLTKFGYEYCTKYFGLDTFICTSDSNSIMTDFYEGVVCFSRLAEAPSSNYSFGNYVPVTGLVLNLDDAYFRWLKQYSHEKKKNNLFSYFTELKWDCFHFPKRTYHSYIDNLLSPDILQHFFELNPELSATLVEDQKATLLRIYKAREYKELWQRHFSQSVKAPINSKRSYFEFRFPSYIKGKTSDGRKSYSFKVLDLSIKGLKVRFENNVDISQVPKRLKIELLLNEFTKSDLDVELSWINTKSMILGFSIVSHDEEWSKQIQYLNNSLSGKKVRLYELNETLGIENTSDNFPFKNTNAA